MQDRLKVEEDDVACFGVHRRCSKRNEGLARNFFAVVCVCVARLNAPDELKNVD